MALTVADVDGGPPSPVVGAVTRFGDVVKDVTFDSSYATGGETLTPGMLGLTSIVALIANPSPQGYVHPFDAAAGKLMALRSGAANGVLVEATSTGDLSAVKTRVWARGAF